MLLAWMAYAVLFGAFVFVAALAADRLAATWNRQRRFVWVVAILAVAAAPLLFATRPASRLAAPPGEATESAPVDVDISAGVLRTSHEAIQRPGLPARIDPVVSAAEPYIGRAWLVASFACFVLLLRAMLAVRRQRGRWRPVDLDGIRVLVAEQTGPAVVGVLAPAVVIPRWALGLDAEARSLMLSHESEHIRARDPLLLFMAAFATMLFPWNAALWLLVRRLRLAIEIDCDRRVLRVSPIEREYGMLLLTVGARRAEPLPFAASLAERRGRPFLERRIKAMTSTSPKHPRMLSLTCLTLAIAATTAAVRAPRPRSLVVDATATPAMRIAPAARAAAPAISTPDVPPPPIRVMKSSIAAVAALPNTPSVAAIPGRKRARLSPDSLTVAEIRAMIAAHQPTALEGDPNINTITLIVDASGNYVTSLAENRPFVTIGPADGGGFLLGRARSGGAGPDGSAGFGGGRGGRGGATENPPNPPDTAMRIQLAMAKAQLQNLLTKLEGDTIFFAMRTAVPRPDGAGNVVQMEDGGVLAGQKRLGDLVGLNMTALNQLIDMESVDSVHVRTFTDGQLGATALRVYVVRLKP
jgi:beta-lactamase regulating signal transducer with metallopeptidase domain